MIPPIDLGREDTTNLKIDLKKELTKKEMKEIRRHVRETDMINAKEEGLDHKGDLEKELMEMPELEQEEELMEIPILNNAKETQEYYDNCTRVEEGLDHKGEELIHKRMDDINTFQAHENEVYLRGIDEYGKDFQICFDAYNFLEWIDTEHLKYIKKQLIKHIKSK